ncbi:hypothetical protein [Deinococcus yavapaiensis]|uniref:Uncharacterized protein n=1 Tax=Deinococcus yavapaiensis KR-236 TaxID=694435 RepID=A0A318RZ02_9DEIO|nr:hypothetical protein [Deinococcus yavapaiensis]PYE48350.1 hypothetical protein DES52_13120 [Deinococcus yavapaiensis KR-236]
MIAVVAALDRRASPAATVRIALSNTAGSAAFREKKRAGQGRELAERFAAINAARGVRHLLTDELMDMHDLHDV